ncbi:restriction endonuclease subunit S [Paracoccus benzoatiresistens]|uniref:Restriction endonuclease subunit S n=1 Tax=Paracoccus benzoatiresistens TaxID=2997341 RepID=A0ABT4J9R1_9RHOB|nr:restriction endonuclease subunit S [Paracoccus sp. EF6]MCZ0963873.1 restriction endonuclease subunit S [Paracoccus sp. EF6]
MTRRYPAYRDSGVEWLGEVPEGWKVSRFRHLFRESSEKIDTEVVGVMLSVSGYRGIEIKEYDDENRRRLDEDLVGYRIVRPGQLVVNTMWLNYAGLGVSEYEGHVSPAYRAYDFVPEVERRYFHHLLRSDLYVKGYTRLLTGIRPNSLQMGRDDLMDFPVLVPPQSDQTAIATFLDRETAKIDALVDEQRRLIVLLCEKRQAVISHAVTKGLNPEAPLKPSGVDWLGDVPEGWEVTPLKHMCSHVVDCLHTTPTYDGVLLYPAIRTADVERGCLKLNQARLVSEEVYLERIQRLRPQENDIVYSREGERLGLAALVPSGVDLCLGQRMMMFRVRDGLDPTFVMWALNSDSIYEQVVERNLGSTSPHVNIGDVVNFRLAIPSLSEQRAISSFVTTQTEKIDATIATSQSAIALLQERRAVLISAATTGKIDVRRLATTEVEAA